MAYTRKWVQQQAGVLSVCPRKIKDQAKRQQDNQDWQGLAYYQVGPELHLEGI